MKDRRLWPRRYDLLILTAVIGGLAWMAVRDFGRAQERAEVSMLSEFWAGMRRAQEDRYSRQRAYTTDSAQLPALDFILARVFRLENLQARDCPSGSPGYEAAFVRLASPRPPARYGRYRVIFSSCSGKPFFPECPRCGPDLLDSQP